MDAVLLWPRLLHVIPEKYTERLEEANNSISFLLTSSLLFFAIGAECVPIYFLSRVYDLIIMLWLIVPSLIVSFISYRLSLRAAINFGEIVKSCFDLFRYDLMKVFGIEGNLSLDQERKFWQGLKIFLDCNEGDPFANFIKYRQIIST